MSNSAMASPSSYSKELSTALDAVHRASILTKDVMRGIDAFDKSDASPVTIADFAAQALIICAIHHLFPNDDIIAEESADLLRKDVIVRDRVWKLVTSAASITNNRSTAIPKSALPLPSSPEEMMDLIDLGGKTIQASSARIWCLDPIDGTKTFLTSQQYAVCLCLIIEGRQTVGVLGCPNLPWSHVSSGKIRGLDLLEDLTDRDGYGCILYAMETRGSSVAALGRTDIGDIISIPRLEEAPTELKEARFLDSIQSSSRDPALHQKVYDNVQVQKPVMDIWSTQVKYAALALGAGDAWFRIAPKPEHILNVWDHAGGILIYRETGGIVQSIRGKQFDFVSSRQFEDTWGYVAARARLFPALMDAINQVLEGGATV